MRNFTTLAASFRMQIAKQWSIRCGVSPALAIEQVVNEAVSVGLLNEPRMLPGNTFTDWASTGKSPAWAAQAMLNLLLKSGWVPGTESEWAGVAAIQVRSGKSLPDEDYVEKLCALSPALDQLTAAGWIHAALLENEIFVYEKNARIKR